MFPIKNASELSDTQSLFLHWIELYDWVFSLPDNERPNDRVIHDDVSFDVWHKSFLAKRMSDSRGSSASGKSASSHDHVINFG
jgi:hypothetical protein